MFPIRRVTAALAALTLTTLGMLALASPALAAADDCKTVTVDLPERPDSGVKGNDWALNDLKRSMKVCVDSDQSDTPDGWRYHATVTDEGTFTTVAGDSPGGTAALVAGVKGTVKGGFEATFTAAHNWGGYNTDAVTGKTSTGKWVETAFPGALFDKAGPVARWSWTYSTTCESWTNAEAGNTGDIAGKVCPPKVKFTPATCDNGTAYLNVTNPNGHATLKVRFDDGTAEGMSMDVKPGAEVSHAWAGGTVQVVVDGKKLGEPYGFADPKGCPTPGPSTGATEPAVAGGSGGGSLPVTGAGVATAVGAGLLAVAIGGGLFLAAWRRRTTFTS